MIAMKHGLLATGNKAGVVEIWGVDGSGAFELLKQGSGGGSEGNDAICSLCDTKLGNPFDDVILVSGYASGSIAVWRLGGENLELFRKVERAHTNFVMALVAVTDRERVVSGSLDGKLKVWDLKNLCRPEEAKGLQQQLRQEDDDDGGSCVLSIGFDSSLLHVLMVLLSDGTLCVGEGRSLKRRSLEDGRCVSSIEEKGAIFSVSQLPDGTVVYTSQRDAVNLWRYPSRLKHFSSSTCLLIPIHLYER